MFFTVCMGFGLLDGIFRCVGGGVGSFFLGVYGQFLELNIFFRALWGVWRFLWGVDLKGSFI